MSFEGQSDFSIGTSIFDFGFEKIGKFHVQNDIK